jgi:outer membrane lipoprotein-sorting protein
MIATPSGLQGKGMITVYENLPVLFSSRERHRDFENNNKRCKRNYETMAWMKLKFAICVGLTAFLASGVTMMFIPHARGETTSPSLATSTPAPSASDGSSTNASPLGTQPVPACTQSNDALTAEAIIKNAKATYAALQSYSDSGTAVAQTGSFSLTTKFKIRLQRPSLYRIDWQGSSVGVTWSDGTGDFLQYSGLTAQKQQDRQMALAGATGISSGAAASIPGTFFGDNWGGELSGEHQRKKDEMAGEVDCYVVWGELKRNGTTISRTLWIGKQDNLMHQIKTVMEGLSKAPQIDDSSLKTILTSQNKPVTPEAMDALRKELTAAQEKAEAVLKSGKIEFTESHANIVTNKTFAPADFKPETN